MNDIDSASRSGSTAVEREGKVTMAQLYTAAEVAEILKVGVSWVRTQAARRAIPCTFVGKHLRFCQGDIDWIVANGHRLPITSARARYQAANRSPRNRHDTN